MAKLLIIEDSIELTIIYKDFFKEHEVTFALERPEIEAAIDQVDLVICDYHFNPNLSFEQVKEIVGNRKPLILVSGEYDKVAQYKGCHKMDISKELRGLVSNQLGLSSRSENLGATIKSIG